MYYPQLTKQKIILKTTQFWQAEFNLDVVYDELPSRSP
jgi:hypothetical protein